MIKRLKWGGCLDENRIIGKRARPVKRAAAINQSSSEEEGDDRRKIVVRLIHLSNLVLIFQ